MNTTASSAPETIATDMESYLDSGLDAGCPVEQLANLARAGIILQPRQLAASAAGRLCDAPDGPTAIGYGGARGGGKSHWLLAQMGADDCQRVPGLKYRRLRKVGKSNLENLGDLRHRVLAKLPHEFSSLRATLTFASGSRIVSGHFQHESDIDAYLGLEDDVIGIEEATTLTSRPQEIPVLRRSIVQILHQRDERGLGPVGNQPANGGPATSALRYLRFGVHARLITENLLPTRGGCVNVTRRPETLVGR